MTASTTPAKTRDCGTCSFCDPAPSDLTHFHRWSARQCQRPIPVTDTETA